MTIAIITEDGVRKVAPLVLDAKAQADLAATYLAQMQVIGGAIVAAGEGRIYPTYSAGNAATTTGEYFFVASAGSYALHIHGTATALAPLPVLDPATGNLMVGGATGAQATPTKVSLDGSFANTPSPTNQQLKVELLKASGTEAYGLTLDNIGRLWYHSGDSAGSNGGHIFAVGDDAMWGIDSDGRLVCLVGLTNAADDAAASGLGVGVNALYRTGSAVKIRVS